MAGASARPAEPQARTPSSHAYWGARVGTHYTGTMSPWDMTAQALFEQAARKKASLVHWGAPFMAPDGSFYEFDVLAAENVRRHSALSVYDWAPWQSGRGAVQPEFSLDSVVAGQWDWHMRRWFRAVKRWGHPIFLRFGWEMNGGWFPWGVGVNGNTPRTFVRAWRHVHELAKDVGARNVTWVWCPNITPLARLRELYPGPAYVDWTCLDGYNWGSAQSGQELGWQPFDRLFRAAYLAVRSLAPDKPMMIGEVASSENGGSKAAWIRDMLSVQLPRRYPAVRAVLWFEQQADGMDWPIVTSGSAGDAFAAAIANPYYVQNAPASRRASPIAPP